MLSYLSPETESKIEIVIEEINKLIYGNKYMGGEYKGLQEKTKIEI